MLRDRQGCTRKPPSMAATGNLYNQMSEQPARFDHTQTPAHMLLPVFDSFPLISASIPDGSNSDDLNPTQTVSRVYQ